MGYLIPRENFGLLFSVFALSFAAMLFLKWFSKPGDKWIWIFLGGLVLRLILLFALPAWSEDYARFLWDGELLRLGFNPYLATPNEFVDSHLAEGNLFLADLLDRMNSPDYYSVYPPLNQLVFWRVAIAANLDPLHGIIAFRLVIIAAEIGIFFLLRRIFLHFGIFQNRIILYWLNPLVILELSGNIHFEVFVLLFLLIALYSIVREKFLQSGFFLGLSVGVKLVPLILFPSLLAYPRIRLNTSFWAGIILALGVSFVWLLLDDSWINFLQSVKLYQGKFEFNSSVYYLLREVGFWIKGYNTIANLTRILAVITFVLILYFSWKRKPKSPVQLTDLFVLIYLIYLILQPVVHPWYLIPALGLGLLASRQTFLIWSFAAVLSYQAYGNSNYFENPLFLMIEYSLVAIGVYLDYFHRERNPKLIL